MKGYSIIVTIILAFVLFAAINDGCNRTQEISQLHQEKFELMQENQALKLEMDSLDSLIKTIPTESAPQIITRIVTRYEKDFHHIDSADAHENFSLFTEWISKIDSTAKW